MLRFRKIPNPSCKAGLVVTDHAVLGVCCANWLLLLLLFQDLSKNQLTEFPKDVCAYDSLERLTLYSNVIKSVPEQITSCQLKCLRILDLNCNSLSYLPPSLCNLTALQVLTVNNNKLVSLPEEIARLDRLIQLDVSCNEITHLPVQIGDMTSLRALNVRRNLLVELPKGELLTDRPTDHHSRFISLFPIRTGSAQASQLRLLVQSSEQAAALLSRDGHSHRPGR